MGIYFLSLLVCVILITFATQSHGSFLCFANSQCNLTQSQQLMLQEAKCCQFGGQSFSTFELNNGQALYGDCMQCQFVLNITIHPSQQYYTTSTRFSPRGGELIFTFPVELNLNYFPLNNSATLPTAFPFPQESTITLFYKEGTGEAIEYSRLDQRSGSLTTGIIKKNNYSSSSGVPIEKFIPTVRNESYNGTVLILAEYLLASSVVEVGYEFEVLECLECNNGGHPNVECTECNCLEGFVGKLCDNHLNTTNTLCTNDTCQNNGTCNSVSFANTSCNCEQGFNGSFCEFDLDECSTRNHTCGNSGDCQNTFGSYACVCDLGFTGDLCDVDIDECQKVFCAQHSICINMYGSFKCTCDDGYTGEYCDSIILPCDRANCTNDTVVCINSQPGNSVYTCVCKNGFEGLFCENDINECQNVPFPCSRGGKCINTNGGYNCQNQTIGFVDEQSIDSSSKVAISIGVILILLFAVMGVGIIITWIVYLVRRYRRTVRYYARHVMVEQLEEERLHYKDNKKIRIGKYRKKQFMSQNSDPETSFAMNHQAEARDDGFAETIL